MPRYIDAEKLIAEYDRVHIGPAGGARKLMVEAPTEDVVPRAEFAEEIFDEIVENADLLYDGFRDILVITEKDFSEIQKKYTEDNK